MYLFDLECVLPLLVILTCAGIETGMPLKIPDFICGNENTGADEERISRLKVCDGIADCKNSADENFEVCSQLRCPPNFFQCEYGACIRHEYFCNGVNNCVDGSDEAHCGQGSRDCGYQEYHCKSGMCIGADAVCNGQVDCDDGSDESNAVCARHICPSHFFQCTYGGCISLKAVCNGVANCRDKSDEFPSLCRRECETMTSRKRRIKCTTGCKENELRCSSGKCISRKKICDGVIDCAGDGYDEALTTCSSFHCPVHAFRCRYGACIEAAQACDGVLDCADGSDENLDLCKEQRPENSCIMPFFPTNGIRSYDNRAYVPHHWAVNFSCNPGFKLKGNDIIYCNDGSWVPSAVPTCEPSLEEVYCPAPALDSRNIVLKCFLPSNISHDCDKPAPEGTVANYSCNNLYVPVVRVSKNTSKCQNGEWSEKIPQCKIGCGQSGKVAMPLILHGEPTHEMEWPWQVALYVTEGGREGVPNNMKFRCAGSLLYENIVITAAHCVWHIRSKEMVAAIGKYFRNYGQQQNFTQFKEIKEIVMHPAYSDIEGSYESDIALLVLVSPVKFSSAVLPVCLDKCLLHTTDDLSPQSIGTVFGWGNTESGFASDIPMKAKLLVVNMTQCRHELPLDMKKFLRSNTFCAGYRNGTGLCNGDSGGGLMFKRDDGSWMIQGIVSLSPRGKNGTCHLNHYGIFTRVGSYMEWLENNVKKYTKESFCERG